MNEQQVYGMAQVYYPNLWKIERLRVLVAASKLTAAHYEEITGETYAE